MKKLVLSFLFIGLFAVCSSQQAEYDQLKAKIEAEEGEPHADGAVSKDFEEYIRWLEIKAADRGTARDLSSKYSMAGNPYWEERFLNLVDLAQESGETTLWMADYLFLRIKTKSNGIGGEDWTDAVFKSEDYGKRLYQKAVELSYDSDYIRESVRCLMRFALGDVETGHVALYSGRVKRHGTQFDSEGNLLMPDMDFDILCLPSSAFHIESEGTQGVPVDKGLGYVQEIREVCEWFELFEYNEGTDLMNHFLQDFLCFDKHNPDKSLNWYLSLARKYKLSKSEEYILGFYGTLYGKVEVQEGEKTRDASGARVQVTDDNNALKTDADESGNYAIAKAPLHCKCPPIPIFAELEGDRVDSKYTGELSEPDPEKRQKKDLLIMGSGYAWTGTINLEVSQTFYCDVEEPVSDLSYSRTKAADHKRSVANITLGLSDFDLPSQGTSGGAKLQYISGQVTTNMREDHTTEGYAQKTDCVSEGKHEWVSPGNWGITHKTMAGQAYCDIEDGGLTLLIVKEMLGDKEAMDNMQQQMAEMQARLQEALKTMDTKAMENIKGEMSSMVQGDQSNSSIPIKVSVNIFTGSINYPVYTSYRKQTYNVCLGDFDDNDSRSEIVEMPFTVPLGVEMKGHYTKDDKGNDRIEASINDSEPYYVTSGSSRCPEGEIRITGNIILVRKKN